MRIRIPCGGYWLPRCGHHVAASPSSKSLRASPVDRLTDGCRFQRRLFLRSAPPLLPRIVGFKILEVYNFIDHKRSGGYSESYSLQSRGKRDINTKVNLRDMTPIRVYSTVKSATASSVASRFGLWYCQTVLYSCIAQSTCLLQKSFYHHSRESRPAISRDAKPLALWLILHPGVSESGLSNPLMLLREA